MNRGNKLEATGCRPGNGQLIGSSAWREVCRKQIQPELFSVGKEVILLFPSRLSDKNRPLEAEELTAHPDGQDWELRPLSTSHVAVLPVR